VDDVVQNRPHREENDSVVGLVGLLVKRMEVLSSEVAVDLQAPEDSSHRSGLDGHCHMQDHLVEEDPIPLYSHHDSHRFHHFHGEADTDPHDRDSNVDRADARIFRVHRRRHRILLHSFFATLRLRFEAFP
jgi:hypothetical protein